MATTITLPYSPATINGMAAVALHASKDGFTPILCAVQVTQRHFVATDRFTVGQWEHTSMSESIERHGETGPADPDATIILPRTAAEWLTKQLPKPLGIDRLISRQNVFDEVEIVITNESISIQYSGPTPTVIATTVFPELKGNYPPISRLFPADISDPGNAPAQLNPTYLAKFCTGAAKAADKNSPILMTNTRVKDSYKPGPVLIEFAADKACESGYRFRGLIQPNLISR
jgi:hypothetical protein